MKKRIVALILTLLMVFACAPAGVLATEDTAATTATTAEKSLLISEFYLFGSNQKYYYSYPSIKDGGNKFSFSVPDWMESCTIYLVSSAAKSVTCEGADVSSSGSTYKLAVELKDDTTKLTCELKDSSDTRTLKITINRTRIDCKIETLRLLDDDGEEIEGSGSVADGLEYTFPAGTDKVHMRLVARHENEAWLENLTTDSSGVLVEGEQSKRQLEIQYSRYDVNLKLINGTNLFKITVSAGSVTVTSDIKIIVGDAAANTVTTTASTTTTTETTTTAPTTAPTSPTVSAGGNLLSVFSNMSTGMGILIGIIITVIIGAFIFMIVNMSSGSGNRDDYSEPDMPLYQPRRRNLSDYADDDYYDDYGIRSNRGRSSGRDDYGYGGRDGYSRDDYGRDDYGYGGRGRGRDSYGSDSQRSSFGYEDDDDYGGY